MGQGRIAGGLGIHRGCSCLTVMAAVCLLQDCSAACYRRKKGGVWIHPGLGFCWAGDEKDGSRIGNEVNKRVEFRNRSSEIISSGN